MATVKIQSKATNAVFEFETLDAALRSLNGVTENGDRFNQPLLTTPSRRTFKEAHSLLERNGYTIYRDPAEVKPVEVKVEVPLPSFPPRGKYSIHEAMTKILKGGVQIPSPADDAELSEMFKKSIEKSKAELAKMQAKVEADLKKEMREKMKDQDPSNAWEFMAQQIQKFLEQPKIDQDQLKNELKSEINETVSKALESRVKEIVVVKAETGERKNIGRQHYQFEILLSVISARVNALLVGPAGSGKTSAAHKVAEALSIPFYSISVGMQTTKTDFFGYMDATGKYVKTLFRQAFEHGGVFLIDEMDAGNANVITSINQALANGYCAFPDGMITKHEDFVIVASANTYGTGANREYVGRNQLDAATLDRFAVIDWNYDEELENELCSNKNWLRVVRTARKNAEKHKIRTVVSPRAAIFGSQLLAQGIDAKAVRAMLLTKGLNPTEAVKLMEGV